MNYCFILNFEKCWFYNKEVPLFVLFTLVAELYTALVQMRSVNVLVLIVFGITSLAVVKLCMLTCKLDAVRCIFMVVRDLLWIYDFGLSVC